MFIGKLRIGVHHRKRVIHEVHAANVRSFAEFVGGRAFQVAGDQGAKQRQSPGRRRGGQHYRNLPLVDASLAIVGHEHAHRFGEPGDGRSHGTGVQNGGLQSFGAALQAQRIIAEPKRGKDEHRENDLQMA